MKFLIAVAFTTILPQAGFSQKSHWGAEGGLNVSTVRVHPSILFRGVGYTTTYFNKNHIAPMAGIFYQYNLIKPLGIRAGLRYMGLGYQDNTTGNKIAINYMTIPVGFSYALSEHFSLNAAAYLSFTLGGTNINNAAITSIYHKNDDGITFGAEQQLYKNISLGINYLIGLKNIILADVTTQGTFQYTNRALQFVIIYNFRK